MPAHDRHDPLYRAQGALRAHLTCKGTPSHWKRTTHLFDPACNPDLAGDVTDLIADALIFTHAKGLDPLKVLSAALSHVPALGEAYAAIAVVLRARAEPQA